MTNDILVPSAEYVHGVAAHAHAKEMVGRADSETAPAVAAEAALGEVTFGGTATVTKA